MSTASAAAPVTTVLLGDPRLPDASKPGGRFTEDDLEQVRRLRAALEELTQARGDRFELIDDHTTLVQRLAASPPAFVLNFCDTGFRNDARRELHLPALLELLEVPCSGSGPLALGVCYDKSLLRAVAAACGVPVPGELFLAPHQPLPEVQYPAFIKPNRGDGSLGITEASLVHERAQAEATVTRLRAELPGADLLVQEYLSGDEYGLGMVGNPGHGFAELPMLEVDYDALDPSLPRLLSYASKVDPSSPYWTGIRYRGARLDAATQARTRAWCAALFERLGLRDCARFDFRADAGGALKLMEVNPNPAWCWDGKLAHMGALAGLRHSGVLALILDAARARCGLGAER